MSYKGRSMEYLLRTTLLPAPACLIKFTSISVSPRPVFPSRPPLSRFFGVFHLSCRLHNLNQQLDHQDGGVSMTNCLSKSISLWPQVPVSLAPFKSGTNGSITQSLSHEEPCRMPKPSWATVPRYFH